MRCMLLVKATRRSEAGIKPDEALLGEMGRYNEELMRAGVLLAREGLHPTSEGVRVRFSGERRAVVEGAFTEREQLVAGFWLIQVRSMDEAIEWVRRCPNPMPGESEIEIRQCVEADDFGDTLRPQPPAQEEGTGRDPA